MPSKMFYNIKKEKREKFLEAAREEFTSKSYEKASIYSIVKKVGISRGSFYNYFESLEELFLYLFKSIKDERFIYVLKTLEEVNYNIFDFYRKLFVHDFQAYTGHNRYSFYKNFINYVKSSETTSIKEQIITPIIKMLSERKPLSEIMEIVGADMSEIEFFDVLDLTMTTMIDQLYRAEKENCGLDIAFETFNRKLTIIQKGVQHYK